MNERPIEQYAPPFQADSYTEDERQSIAPFFTNLDQPVYVPLIFSPELIGALCSRTSRAAEDLRRIYLREFIKPFLNPTREKNDTDETFVEKTRYGDALKKFIAFLEEHSITDLFANPRARAFYVKWLAEYGDDSIAQMAGCHLVYTGISQIAIKHFEDQRIGLAPLEKSTRYVDYSKKINGSYVYYTDPSLEQLRLAEEYKAATDALFETYIALIPRLETWLARRFPEEKPSVIEKKAFDTLRGLLPTSTLSQVAFFGNGQAFEYMVTRSRRHALGEIRWAAERAKQELNILTPAFLRRLDYEAAATYQEYLAKKGERVAPFANARVGEPIALTTHSPEVRLVEYDPLGQEKIITGILFAAPENHVPWNAIMERVRRMPDEEKQSILAHYLKGRTARWQKVGRAFENCYVRFEIVMNIGAWRDLQRHRMLTQERQDFTVRHGYDVPQELADAKIEAPYREALDQLGDFHFTLAARDPTIAQYAVALAHRIRFMQWQNLRSFFWMNELRTIPEGHPDYRRIEQKKFQLIKKVYPLLADFIMANLDSYDFARRGQEEKIQAKTEELMHLAS